jgi:hypothetical protein
MEPDQRLSVEEAFRLGELDVVVATKAFGLGIDKPDIAAVVHLEMPASVEEYVQETGRAARGAADGVGPSVGYCVLLRTPRDCGIHRVFVNGAAPETDVVRRVWDHIAEEGAVLLPAEELASRAGMGESDALMETVPLAVHYLVESGVVRRHADVMWAGRVWLPPDSDAVLDQLDGYDQTLARAGRELIERVTRLGTEEYDALSWSRRLNTDPWDLEEQLLALNRRDVIGLAAWQFAIRIERVPDADPDWRTIDQRTKLRRNVVKELSDRAKEYARQDALCLRGGNCLRTPS